MTTPSFSVVIPTHDRDDTLLQAVSSALAQTLPPLEIIVVDDGPTKQTQRNIKGLATASPCPIHYIPNPDNPYGTYGSRNIGAQTAQGTYLANLDDDDYWDECYLERSAALIEDSGAQIILSPVTAFTDTGKYFPGKIPPREFHLKDFITQNPGVISSNIILSRQHFFAVNGYDMSVHGSSDKDIFIQMKLAGCTHAVHDRPLVFWRTAHAGQWSVDSKRLLPGVVGFYKKYAPLTPPLLHVAMLWKISKLFFKAYIGGR